MILFLRFFAAFIYFIMATSMVSQLVDDEDFNKSAKPIIAVFAFMLVVGGVLLVKGGF